MHPNILHLLSHTHSFRPSSSPHPSPPSLLLTSSSSSATRSAPFLLLTPYSFKQHWKGFVRGGSTGPAGGDWVALPSTGVRAVAWRRAFRSSRSPHRRNSFSRRVSSAAGDLRRLRRGCGVSPHNCGLRVRKGGGGDLLFCFELQ